MKGSMEETDEPNQTEWMGAGGMEIGCYNPPRKVE